jgi:hypothetical protein
MQLHTRIEELATGFWVVADATAAEAQRAGPFPTREEAKVQEIKTRMDLRLREARAASTRPTRAA